jgi:hypothetical protein
MKITSVLRNILIEDAKFDNLYTQLVEPAPSNDPSKPSKPKLKFETLKQFIFADPTTKVPEGTDTESLTKEDIKQLGKKFKTGTYVQWLLKNFFKPTFPDVDADTDVNGSEYKNMVKEYKRLYLEDLYKMEEILAKFERVKPLLDVERFDLSRIPNYEVFKNKEKDIKDVNSYTPDSMTRTIFALPEDLLTRIESKDIKAQARTIRKVDDEDPNNTPPKIRFAHPGAQILMVGSKYTLIKIDGTGEAQRQAAWWYGGNQEHSNGESRWCTSPANSSYFMTYAKKGPLYVIFPNNDGGERGKTTKLPKERYQLSFPEVSQFMDRDDQQINLVQYLSPGGKFEEFKELLKDEMAVGLVTKDSKVVEINYPNSSAGKFVALYGFNELFNSLPADIISLHMNNSSKDNIALDVPETLGRFTELESIMFTNMVKTLPNVFGKLQNLYFLSLPENSQLTEIPESVADCPELVFLVLTDSNKNVKIPERLLERLTEQGNQFYSTN